MCESYRTLWTSPQLTAEWENNLTQIAKEQGTRRIYRGYRGYGARTGKDLSVFFLMIKRRCSSRNGKRWEAAPAAVLLSMRERKTTIAAIKNVSLPCGKNDRFFEERKVAFTQKIAAALLKSGKVNVKKLYSPKTGKTYDGTMY